MGKTASGAKGESETPPLPEVGPTSVGITRRGVVVGAASVVALIAVGGIGKALTGEARLLRPPGGQHARLFDGSCIKCDRCRSVCPTGVIDVAHVEDGLIHARTPKMDFRKGSCNFCDGAFRCAQNCPTQALTFGFDPTIDKLGMAVVDSDECLLYRSGSGMCSKQCITACTYGALSLDEGGRLVVDEDRCNGCGACEHDCPSSSYVSYTGSGRRGINIEAWEGNAS